MERGYQVHTVSHLVTIYTSQKSGVLRRRLLGLLQGAIWCRHGLPATHLGPIKESSTSPEYCETLKWETQELFSKTYFTHTTTARPGIHVPRHHGFLEYETTIGLKPTLGLWQSILWGVSAAFVWETENQNCHVCNSTFELHFLKRIFWVNITSGNFNPWKVTGLKFWRGSTES